MRISGMTLPDGKRVDIALSYLYGIGRNNVSGVLKDAKVEANVRVRDLTEDDQKRITKALETIKVEGDLRAEVAENIKRLRESGTYRGIRHTRGLPSRGQRTKSNARTKRGKRMTIGAIKKELAAKMEVAAKAKTSGK